MYKKFLIKTGKYAIKTIDDFEEWTYPDKSTFPLEVAIPTDDFTEELLADVIEQFAIL